MSYYGITETGLKRKSNQDYYKIALVGNDPVAVLCDGMGGAAGGAVASKIAVDSFIEYFEKNCVKISGGDDGIKTLMLEAGEAAHRSVYECSREYTELDGMGTTLVACFIKDNKLHIINAGDSRLYVFKDKELIRITKDHSLVQQLIDKGKITAEEARSHPYRNYIMRALGTEEHLTYDYFGYDGQFDSVILCSDGLYNFISEEQIINILSSADLPKEKLNKLTDGANKGGGGDNITAVLYVRD